MFDILQRKTLLCIYAQIAKTAPIMVMRAAMEKNTIMRNMIQGFLYDDSSVEITLMTNRILLKRHSQWKNQNQKACLHTLNFEEFDAQKPELVWRL